MYNICAIKMGVGAGPETNILNGKSYILSIVEEDINI